MGSARPALHALNAPVPFLCSVLTHVLRCALPRPSPPLQKVIGFVAALASELGNGESVFAQLISGGAAKALLVILAVTLASFAPVVRGKNLAEVFGKDKNPAEFGPFTPMAEIING